MFSSHLRTNCKLKFVCLILLQVVDGEIHPKSDFSLLIEKKKVLLSLFFFTAECVEFVLNSQAALLQGGLYSVALSIQSSAFLSES